MSIIVTAALAKIHRAVVTAAELDYVGSITIDSDLLAACGMQQYQQVHINSVTNGKHWETYILAGPAGLGDVCLNGPPAHFFKKGDIVIIVAYGQMTPDELKKHAPIVLFVDSANKITSVKKHTDVPLGVQKHTDIPFHAGDLGAFG